MSFQDNIEPIVSIASGHKQLFGRKLLAACSLVPRQLILWLRRRHEVRRSRRALERLTSHELRDIGLTRNQALTEYRKSLFID